MGHFAKRIVHAIWNIFASLVIFFLFEMSASAQERQLPPTPFSPSEEDCSTYSREFWRILSELSAQESQCMNQPPIFGKVLTCSGTTTISAWSQCESISLRKCQFERNERLKVDACFNQARASAINRQAELRKVKQSIDQMKKIKKIYDQINSTVDTIKDPQKNLRKGLSKYAKEKIEVFGANGDQFDATLAQEIYRYVHGGVEHGMGMTSNMLIKKIQLNALNHLKMVHQGAIQELDSLSAQLKTFDSNPNDVNRPVQHDKSRDADQQLCKLLETC